MNREEVNGKLTEIFRDNFDDDNLVLTDETTAEDIEDWDSLAQIDLIVAIQKEFDIKLKIKEVNSTKNVGEMIDLILNKVNA